MTDLRIEDANDQSQLDGCASFTFSFDSSPVVARVGETIGAALTAAGITHLRTTRRLGRPRGIFCGIGLCYDCLVVVDGRPGVRACQTLARPEAIVTSRDGVGAAGDAC